MTRRPARTSGRATCPPVRRRASRWRIRIRDVPMSCMPPAVLREAALNLSHGQTHRLLLLALALGAAVGVADVAVRPVLQLPVLPAAAALEVPVAVAGVAQLPTANRSRNGKHVVGAVYDRAFKPI